MATATSSTDKHAQNETDDDNISDDDDWNYKNFLITNDYPFVPMDGSYFRPEDFSAKSVSYGDGGGMTLDYPIWLCGGLSEHMSDVSTNVREDLLKVFYQLNDERKDFNKYPLPVEDIIDPDLLVCKPITPPPPPSIPSHILEGRLSGDYELDDRLSEPWNKWHFNSSSLRGSYQWIPSEFRICRGTGNDYEVHIETPIIHLPMNEDYAQTYRHLEKLFAKLMPMFSEVMNINLSNNDARLQVVVKVQSYNIQPKTKYSGRWHTEGYTENIQAAGVYYLEVDDLLDGGALRFRPLTTPDKSYADCYQIRINRHVMPQTDVAIVFDNSLPHRFCSIRNSTPVPRRRTFINFFVVSPNYPIYSISISNVPLISYEDLEVLLKSIEDENHQQKLPDLVIDKVLSFVKKDIWLKEEDAKEFRSRVKQEMCREKSGWSGIHFGNSGDIVFIKSADDLKYKQSTGYYDELSSHLIHTESD